MRAPKFACAALLTLAATTAIASVPAAAAAAQLVLAPGSIPGVHAGPPSAQASRADLAAGLQRSLVVSIDRAALQTSTLVGRLERVRSDAFVFGSTSAAVHVLRAWARHRHGGRVAVGAGGYAFASGGRLRRTAAVAWREGKRVGVLVLSAGRRVHAPAELAREYAVLADSYLRTPLPQSAWEQVLAQIKPDGLASKATALQAFSVLYEPLPGVRAPAGARAAPTEGTLVQDWILSYLPQLTQTQQQIVERVLGVPATGARAHAAFYDDPSFTPDPALQKLADHWISVFSEPQYLNTPMNLNVVAGATTVVLKGKSGKLATGNTTPFNAAGNYGSGKPVTCRIRLTAAGMAESPGLRSETLAHEVFHCFQMQIMDTACWGQHPAWIMEGLAKWAELTVDPQPYSAAGGPIKTYLNSPHTPIYEREYDAVGVWGHVQDSEGDLWSKIPSILGAAAAQNNDLALVEAGANEAAFLSSWGSSTVRASGAHAAWQMVSPIIPANGFVEPVSFTQFDGDGLATAASYTTSVYRLGASLGLPLLHIQLTGYGRLSPEDDYTVLNDAWFCTAVGGCVCPSGTEGKLPESRPLELPAFLALSGAPSGQDGTSANITRESYDEFCHPMPKPPPPPPQSSDGNGGSGGDPHVTTFDGAFYDFQAAGEFTLMKATRNDLQIQVRQKPAHFFGNDVAIITAVAVRDGGATIEVDANGATWLNKRRFNVPASGVRLRGGGRLTRGGGLLGGRETVVRWRDGTYTEIWPAYVAGMSVTVHAARDRRHHLAGLLGPYTAGSSSRDFVGRNGVHYTAASNGSPDFGVLYGEFGNSWRIKQSQSLFRYPRGKTTRSYTRLNYPPNPVTVGSLSAAARASAERACLAAGIRSPAVLADCIFDVAVTNNTAYAASDQHLEAAAAGHPSPTYDAPVSPVPWTALSSQPDHSTTLVPTIAATGGQAVVAYRRGTDQAIEAATFMPGGTGVGAVSRTLAFTGWQATSDPVMLPKAGGGLQIIVPGDHSSTFGDPLNGAVIAPRNVDGSFGMPVQLDPHVDSGVFSATLASDGATPLWATNRVSTMAVFAGSTEHDLSAEAQDTAYSPTLGRDASGRLWLAWNALSYKPGVDGYYMMQLDPASGAAIGPPMHVPDSINSPSYPVLPLACAQQCRIVYIDAHTQPASIVSWAPGEGAPTTVFSGKLAGTFQQIRTPVAAYTSDGRLWVAWGNDVYQREWAKLGDARGAGGTAVELTQPPGFDTPASTIATTLGSRLVLATNWYLYSSTASAVWATVVNPPG
jgi:von Willebrand factor type D domain